MKKGNIIIGIGGLTLVFLVLIGNTTNQNLSKSYQVSIPEGEKIDNVQLTNSEIVTSIVQKNQTEYIQSVIQAKVLTSVVESPVDDSKIRMTISKIDGSGLIKDRTVSNPDVFSFLTETKTLPDLRGGKLEMNLDYESKNRAVPVNLSGMIQVILDGVELQTARLSINSVSGYEDIRQIQIGGSSSLSISLDQQKLNLDVGIHKMEIKLLNLSGSIGSKTINKNNVLLYETEIQYSPTLNIFLDDKNVTNEIYPSGDSKIILSTTGTDFVYYQASADMCLNKNTRSYYEPCYYSPVTQQTIPLAVKGIMIKNTVSGKVLLNIPTLSKKETVSLERGKEYEISITEPSLAWKIQTPTDKAVEYTYTCVSSTAGGGTSIPASTTICGHS